MTKMSKILDKYKSNPASIEHLAHQIEKAKEMLTKELSSGKKEVNDNVNRPAHYTQGSIECIDAIKIIIQNLKGIEAFALGNHVKYIWREGLKNGDEDIAKADWYWQKYLKERRERNQP